MVLHRADETGLDGSTTRLEFVVPAARLAASPSGGSTAIFVDTERRDWCGKDVERHLMRCSAGDLLHLAVSLSISFKA
ncbi:hypothetical protein DOTSEDRAFT_75133 [Dothistroma septosporum NZE10]|uniref:Uncharacterized protein n=1 Tax=Dothistroma septosporum (strain NZE10 / CBS 128990) TaxID=675120 RepID=M2XIM6_DOTSN|nr:hypothetical protein DOTSEDRAFT_75133 [Dothistroma septosporum NZE10]